VVDMVVEDMVVVVVVRTEEANSKEAAVVADGSKCWLVRHCLLTQQYFQGQEKSAWVAAKVNCVEGLGLPS